MNYSALNLEDGQQSAVLKKHKEGNINEKAEINKVQNGNTVKLVNMSIP